MRLIGLSLIAINNKSERVSVLSVSLELTNLTCLLVYQPMDFGMREYRGHNKADRLKLSREVQEEISKEYAGLC